MNSQGFGGVSGGFGSDIGFHCGGVWGKSGLFRSVLRKEAVIELNQCFAAWASRLGQGGV